MSEPYLFQIFSPAETMFLTQNKKSELKDFVQVTFLDLLLKKVLKIVDVKQQSNPRDPVRTIHFVTFGENLGKYQPLLHEKLFLIPKILYENSQILPTDYFNTILKTIATKEDFFIHLKKSLVQKNIGIHSLFLSDDISNFKLSDEGIEISNTIKHQLQQLEEIFPEMLARDKEKALALLNQIGGNVFILKNVSLEMMNVVERDILRVIEHQQEIREMQSTTHDGFFYLFYEAIYNIFD